MGVDSVSPFLEYDDKWVILLALTSNKGSQDFQHHGEQPLYEKVLKRSQDWGDPSNLMYVIGATHPESFAKIREITPQHFYLVPGVGAQGGSVASVCDHGKNKDVGLLINSSRGIIFSSQNEDFAVSARESARILHNQMMAEVDTI